MILLIEILLFSMLPPLFFVIFKFSSYSIGLAVSSIIIITMNIHLFRPYKVNKRQVSLIIVILIFLMIPALSSLVINNEFKPIKSFILVPLSVIASYTILLRIYNMKLKKLKKVLTLYIFIMLFFLLLNVIYPGNYLGYNSFTKSIFPYPEPSHFVLSLNLFSIILSFLISPLYILSLGLLYFTIGYTSDSLVMIISSFIILFIFSLHLSKKNLIVLMFVTILFIPIIVQQINSSEYISSRLNFENSTNLSVLVYLQGWELAFNNFTANFGFGLGFQMLGLEGTKYGGTTDILSSLLSNSNLNVHDGGFTASKIIAEFGFIGIIILLLYIKYNFNFVCRLRNKYISSQQNKDSILTIQYIVFSSILFASFLELFVRGIGYFSPTFTLMLASILLLYKDKKGKIVYENI